MRVKNTLLLLTKAVLLGALTLILSGCGTKTSTSTQAPATTKLDPLGLSIEGAFGEDGALIGGNQVATSARSNRDYALLSLRGTTSPDGFKKLQLEVFNHTRSPINLKYRLFWFDADGMDVSSDVIGWQAIQVFGKGSRTVTIVSKSAKAHAFKLYMQREKYNQ